MKRIVSSAAIALLLASGEGGVANAQAVGPSIHNKVTTNQSSSPAIGVPTWSSPSSRRCR